ncbi:MAG: hypothetical protein GY940_17350, partial [bacterium]|nr:hypothetical protein [bacterium]
SPGRIKKAEKIIKEMLLDKGYNQGSVHIGTRPVKPRQLAINVTVNQGPKTRIGSIRFPGLNRKLVSPDFLRAGMKHNKPHSLLTLLGSKDVFNKDKVREDLEGIRNRLRQKGFIEATVGEPVTSMYRKRTALGKIQKMLRIEIPVTPGPQYRIGNVTVAGNKILKSTFIDKNIPLEKGNIYNIKKRDKFIQDLREVY